MGRKKKSTNEGEFKTGSTINIENKSFILLDTFKWESVANEMITVGLVVEVPAEGTNTIFETKVLVLSRVTKEVSTETTVG